VWKRAALNGFERNIYFLQIKLYYLVLWYSFENAGDYRELFPGAIKYLILSCLYIIFV
jgi:hypothetical protein